MMKKDKTRNTLLLRSNKSLNTGCNDLLKSNFELYKLSTLQGGSDLSKNIPNAIISTTTTTLDNILKI